MNDDHVPLHHVHAGNEYVRAMMVNNERNAPLFRFNHA